MNNQETFSVLLLFALLLPNASMLFASASLGRPSLPLEYSDLHSRKSHLALFFAEGLTNQAPYVIVGQVENTDSRWNKTNGVIYSSALIRIDKFLRGSLTTDEVTIVYRGGEIGNVGLIDLSQPRFERGEKVKVCLAVR